MSNSEQKKISVSYIALGSNLNNPLLQIETAFKEIHQIPHTEILKKSQCYESKPVGPQDQPNIINAVVCVATELDPFELLDALQKIENDHGRVRTKHWGPRTLDLDLLLFGELILNTKRLTIPHPEMLKRDFVLYPLAEISPDLILHSGEAIQNVLVKCAKNIL